MTLETLVNGEHVLVDINKVWQETFAHWDSLVDTGTAAEIANAVCDVLAAARKRAAAEGR